MKNKEKIEVQYYDSVCGELILGAFGEAICLCDWVDKKHRTYIDNRLQSRLAATYCEKRTPILAEAAAQLDDYFARRLRRFDLPLMPIGTEFQRRVWDELRRIPYGQTISYKELALRIGNPKAVRAVASANRANPISIIIPCHRVIGSNGRLVGYSGGLDKKETLLQLEVETHTELP